LVLRADYEVLRLRPKDFDFQNNVVNIIKNKKRKASYKNIPIHMKLKTTLMEHILEMHMDPKSDWKLFPMKRQSVDKYFKKMMNEIGFRINDQKLRETFEVKAILSGYRLISSIND
jgi:integrase